MAADSILKMFERVASNLGQSTKLPRPLNKAGKPYGKASYSLASFEKQFPRKSLPLGYRWPGSEPNPLLDCDSPTCHLPSQSESIKRLNCGHTFHCVCLGNNGCTICLPNLIKDIQQLSHAWNERLMKVDDNEVDNNDSDEDNNEDDPDDDDDSFPFPKPGKRDNEYFNSKFFKEYIKTKSLRIKEIIDKADKSHEQ